MKPAVLTLRFASELAMLAALAWGGIAAGGSAPVDIVVGIGAPLAAIGLAALTRVVGQAVAVR